MTGLAQSQYGVCYRTESIAMKIIISFTILVVILMIGLNIMRSYDELRSYIIWGKLEKLPPNDPIRFSDDMISELPEPIQRYFKYMILPDTALKRAVDIKMSGRLGLGPKEAPDYMNMTATQIMAFPEGFIWNIKTGRGPMVVTGSDGLYQNKSWSRFWLMHAIPLGRAGGLSSRREDHHRAAFGRLVAETAFWSPASLLPSEHVSWEAVSSDHVRATVTYQNLIQSVDIYINENGQPIKVTIPRWSDANPENRYQLQPFGGYPSVFKEFEGYRLPTHVEGGNFIGTEDYFPFYIADVEMISFTD